jgi:hypothetical protein
MREIGELHGGEAAGGSSLAMPVVPPRVDARVRGRCPLKRDSAACVLHCESQNRPRLGVT